MYHLIDYVWCVEKFSQYFEPHEQEVYPLLTSPIFAYKNTRWVLNLYPEGLGDTASQGYISLFIKYVSEDPENINAKVELSLLNNKNERVYCRDTGDHQYQTFIDFGYKQFLKIQDIKDQKDDLIFNGQLKIFARVEFEHATLPSSLTWSNYDLLLFKENFKDLYETKNLCDIIIKIIKKPAANNCNNSQPTLSYRNSTVANSGLQNNSNNLSTTPQNQNNSNYYHPYSTNNTSSQNHNYSKVKRPGNKSDTTDTSYSALPDCFNSTLPLNSCTNYSRDCSNCQTECLSNLETNNFFNSNFNSIFLNNNLIKNDNNNNTSFEMETFEIKAHKFILASRSGKFRELLKTNLIKLCTLNNLPQANNDCEKCSKLSENSGCGSFKCIYKNSYINHGIYCAPNENSMTSKNKTEAEISCSSSYASCSTASSSSNSSSDQNSCIGACECQKLPWKNSINSLSKPSSSFLSSSSTEEQNCESRQINQIEKNPCPQCISKQNQRILVTNDDSDITDLLIIETDGNPKVIEYLIRYMYTGYLDTLDSYSKDIYEISKEYKVHGLTNLAREYITKELNNQNCCDYLVFCVINNDYELNNKIQMYIAENYDTIVKTNAYKQAKRKYRELFENTFNEILKKIPTLNKGHY